MAIHSSILSWRIPWTEKPGRLHSTGSQRVRHDWVTNTHILFLHTHTLKIIGILIGIALNQSILLGSDILILNLLSMSMICVSTILWLIILSVMFYNLFTSVLPLWTSLVAQTVKHLPTMQETQTWSLDWEDPLEKEMATHSSTLAWKIPWTEERGRLQSMGSQSRTWLSYFTFFLTSLVNTQLFFFMLLSVELFHNFPFKLFIVNVPKYNWFLSVDFVPYYLAQIVYCL